MTNLFAQPAAADFESRAIRPARELGAYEALWMRENASFKQLAEMFAKNPGSVPSDFVSDSEAQQHSRLALGLIKAKGISHFGIRVNGAGDYPLKLRDADHPVELLYFQGDWDLTSNRCVAIVGTRKCSDEGARRAAKLVKHFLAEKFTIVSGLAQGIDTVAHRTAIEEGGSTIAVLGTPITDCYPPENAELQKRIADDHLLVSQVPIVRHSRQTAYGNKFFFPERNVTMSALTEATVIVEAGNTSGTLIQARHALKQNRKLFILDCCFRNPELTWPAKYAAKGAIRVSDFDEIKQHLAAPT